ncbi:MAG TPA: ABC transporter substrate-binding protein [Terriglobales bacterium]|nr:ABC transporter substrate-binding protein [Terriglobales bacterium]
MEVRIAPPFRTLAATLIFAVLSTTSFAQKQPGISDKEVKFGSCSALDGPARFLGIQTVLGATAYLHYINEQGGVHGRKVQLMAFDDGYDPTKADSCFNRLKKEEVFAAGFFVGTPTAAKYVPLAQEQKLPVVGLFTGAQILYVPLKHYIINVRASYYDETREQVDGLWKINLHKIGVIYQDDAFGKAVLDGVKLALDKHEAKPVALGTFARNTTSVQSGVAAVRAANPDAVVLVGPYAPVAEILKEAHASGWHPLFLTVSFVGTEALIKEAGKDADGIVITQVVPPPDRTDLPTVKLYRECVAKYFPGSDPSYVSLEGFVDAMVAVEGLKRAGAEPTREKFIEGIESIHNMDLGLGPALKLNYGQEDHKGFKKVYVTVVEGGRPIVMDDWSAVKH